MRPIRFLTLLLIIVSGLLLTAAGDQPPTPAPPQTRADLSAAFSRRLQAAPGTQSLAREGLTPELDSASLSPDGKTAVIWLGLREDSGRVLGTEPGLVLARLTGAGWQVLLPGDPGWDDTLASLPDGMLPLELRPEPNRIALDAKNAAAALTGYYLPYAAGTARFLEGSISHFQSIPELGYPSCAQAYCQYAYDFTDFQPYPLLASKDGTVYGTPRDSCLNGSTNCTNFIVLYNASDRAYQIYLHLSHGTIPDKLTPGTAVRRGQYLGDTDDTGYSTSQHVHFMVTQDIWSGGDGYYWGHSVKIQFADVAINNGIPRNCYEVTHFPIYDGATECLGDKSDPRNPANDWFTSGNVGAYPPTGALTKPAAGATVTTGSNPILDAGALVSDDVGVTAVQMVAHLNGQWTGLGPVVTQPVQPGKYDWDVDLCAAGPLNGPLEVAVRAWDYEGNVSAPLSPRAIQVDHACPPPVSQLKPAESFDSTAVRLNWDASSAGAGLGSFELQWREDPGIWDPANTLTVPGSLRSAWFAGQPGGIYAFRLRALDANGQPEPWPAGDAAETSAVLPAACAPDIYEPDDDLALANALPPGEWAQRNLCGPGNPDWFRVDIAKAGSYLVSGLSQSGGAAVSITVYAENGATVLSSGKAAWVGQDAFARFLTAAPGRYYLKVEPLTANLIGTKAMYQVRVSEVKDLFLPLVTR